MFAFFEHSVGVANVRRFAATLTACAALHHSRRERRRLRRAGSSICSAPADGLVAGVSRRSASQSDSFAGLMGIGGGAIMVPLLVFVFGAQGFPAEHLMHFSLATALATIVFTSLSSVRAHHRFGAVEWPVVRSMAPGIVAGSLGAALVAASCPRACWRQALRCFCSMPARRCSSRSGLVQAGNCPDRSDCSRWAR
jgi:hypothetical protein